MPYFVRGPDGTEYGPFDDEVPEAEAIQIARQQAGEPVANNVLADTWNSLLAGVGGTAAQTLGGLSETVQDAAPLALMGTMPGLVPLAEANRRAREQTGENDPVTQWLQDSGREMMNEEERRRSPALARDLASPIDVRLNPEAGLADLALALGVAPMLGPAAMGLPGLSGAPPVEVSGVQGGDILHTLAVSAPSTLGLLAASAPAGPAAPLVAGVLEGSQSAAQSRFAIEEAVLDFAARNPEAFLSSELGAQAIEEANGDFRQAAHIAANRASMLPSVGIGAGVGVLGTTGVSPGRLFAGRGAEEAALRFLNPSHMAEAAVREGLLEEAPQSALEQFGQNVGMLGVDPEQDLMEGVPGSVVMGTIAGGAGGAAFSQAEVATQRGQQRAFEEAVSPLIQADIADQQQELQGLYDRSESPDFGAPEDEADVGDDTAGAEPGMAEDYVDEGDVDGAAPTDDLIYGFEQALEDGSDADIQVATDDLIRGLVNSGVAEEDIRAAYEAGPDELVALARGGRAAQPDFYEDAETEQAPTSVAPLAGDITTEPDTADEAADISEEDGAGPDEQFQDSTPIELDDEALDALESLFYDREDAGVHGTDEEYVKAAMNLAQAAVRITNIGTLPGEDRDDADNRIANEVEKYLLARGRLEALQSQQDAFEEPIDEQPEVEQPDAAEVPIKAIEGFEAAPSAPEVVQRDSSVEERLAHTQEAGGATPPPAPTLGAVQELSGIEEPEEFDAAIAERGWTPQQLQDLRAQLPTVQTNRGPQARDTETDALLKDAIAAAKKAARSRGEEVAAKAARPTKPAPTATVPTGERPKAQVQPTPPANEVKGVSPELGFRLRKIADRIESAGDKYKPTLISEAMSLVNEARLASGQSAIGLTARTPSPYKTRNEWVIAEARKLASTAERETPTKQDAIFTEDRIIRNALLSDEEVTESGEVDMKKTTEGGVKPQPSSNTVAQEDVRGEGISPEATAKKASPAPKEAQAENADEQGEVDPTVERPSEDYDTPTPSDLSLIEVMADAVKTKNGKPRKKALIRADLHATQALMIGERRGFDKLVDALNAIEGVFDRVRAAEVVAPNITEDQRQELRERVYGLQAVRTYVDESGANLWMLMSSGIDRATQRMMGGTNKGVQLRMPWQSIKRTALDNIFSDNILKPARSGIMTQEEREIRRDFLQSVLIPMMTRVRREVGDMASARQVDQARGQYHGLFRSAMEILSNELTYEQRAEIFAPDGWLLRAVESGAVDAVVADDLYHGAATNVFHWSDWRKSTGRDAGPVPVYNYQNLELRGKLADRLRQYMDQAGFKDIAVRLVDSVRNSSGRPVENADAAYAAQLIVVATRGGTKNITDMTLDEAWDEVRYRANHELVHAMRHLGLIKDTEWEVLVNFAGNFGIVDGALRETGPKGSFLSMVMSEAVYKEQMALLRAKGATQEDIIMLATEEAVALAFQNMRLIAPSRPKTMLARIGRILRAFLRSLRAAKVGDARTLYLNAEDIMEYMANGNVGARQRDYLKGVETSGSAMLKRLQVVGSKQLLMAGFKRGAWASFVEIFKQRALRPDSYDIITGPEQRKPRIKDETPLTILNAYNRPREELLEYAEDWALHLAAIERVQEETAGLMSAEQAREVDEWKLIAENSQFHVDRIINILGDEFWNDQYLLAMYLAIKTTRKPFSQITEEEFENFLNFSFGDAKKSDEPDQQLYMAGGLRRVEEIRPGVFKFVYNEYQRPPKSTLPKTDRPAREYRLNGAGLFSQAEKVATAFPKTWLDKEGTASKEKLTTWMRRQVKRAELEFMGFDEFMRNAPERISKSDFIEWVKTSTLNIDVAHYYNPGIIDRELEDSLGLERGPPDYERYSLGKTFPALIQTKNFFNVAVHIDPSQDQIQSSLSHIGDKGKTALYSMMISEAVIDGRKTMVLDQAQSDVFAKWRRGSHRERLMTELSTGLFQIDAVSYASATTILGMLETGNPSYKSIVDVLKGIDLSLGARPQDSIERDLAILATFEPLIRKITETSNKALAFPLDDWRETMFRHLVMLAINNGYEAITWASGDSIRQIQGHDGYKGNTYDVLLPRYARRWLGKYGGKVGVQRLVPTTRNAYPALLTNLYNGVARLKFDIFAGGARPGGEQLRAILDRSILQATVGLHTTEHGNNVLEEINGNWGRVKRDLAKGLIENFRERGFTLLEDGVDRIANYVADQAYTLQRGIEEESNKSLVLYKMDITQEMRDEFRGFGAQMFSINPGRPHSIIPPTVRELRPGVTMTTYSESPKKEKPPPRPRETRRYTLNPMLMYSNAEKQANKFPETWLGKDGTIPRVKMVNWMRRHVKKAELDYMGFEHFARRQGRASKAELLEWVKENKLRLGVAYYYGRGDDAAAKFSAFTSTDRPRPAVYPRYTLLGQNSLERNYLEVAAYLEKGQYASDSEVSHIGPRGTIYSMMVNDYDVEIAGRKMKALLANQGQSDIHDNGYRDDALTEAIRDGGLAAFSRYQKEYAIKQGWREITRPGARMYDAAWRDENGDRVWAPDVFEGTYKGEEYVMTIEDMAGAGRRRDIHQTLKKLRDRYIKQEEASIRYIKQEEASIAREAYIQKHIAAHDNFLNHIIPMYEEEILKKVEALPAQEEQTIPMEHTWPETMFRHLFMMALAGGHDAVAWVSGDTVRSYEGHATYKGDFYDKRLPKYARAWLGKYGAQVYKIDVSPTRQSRKLSSEAVIRLKLDEAFSDYGVYRDDMHGYEDKSWTKELFVSAMLKRLQEYIRNDKELHPSSDENPYALLSNESYASAALQQAMTDLALRFAPARGEAVRRKGSIAQRIARGLKALDKETNKHIYVMPITQEMADEFLDYGVQMFAAVPRPVLSAANASPAKPWSGVQPATAHGFQNSVIPGQDFIGMTPREEVERTLRSTPKYGMAPPHWSKRTARQAVNFMAELGAKWQSGNSQLHIGHRAGAALRQFAYGMTTLGNLPGQGYYVALRARLMGMINAGIEHGERLSKLSARMTDKDFAQFGEYMQTRDADPNLIDNDDVRAAAVLSKKLFNAYGEEAVRVGRMDKRQFEKYRDRYLPRKYFRYIENSLRTTGIRLGAEGFLKQRLPGEAKQIFGALDLAGHTVEVEAIREQIADINANLSDTDRVRVVAYLSGKLRTPKTINEASVRPRLARIRKRLLEIEAHVDSLDLISVAPDFPRGAKTGTRDDIPYGPYQMKKRYGNNFVGRAVARAARAGHSIGNVLERSAINAQITDPVILSATGIVEQNRSAAIFHFLSVLEQFQTEAKKIDPTLPDFQWVRPNQMVTFQGKTMTAVALRNELEETRKNFHLNETPLMKKIVQEQIDQMQRLVNQHDLQDVGEEYVQLPTTKDYANAAGLIIHRAIYNDIKGTLGITTPGADGLMGVIQRGWGSFLSFFKQAMTTLNFPKGHARALFQNVSTMYFSGVGTHDVGLILPAFNVGTWTWFVKALDHMKDNTELWKAAQRLGVRAGTFTTTELRHAHGLVRRLKIQERLNSANKVDQIQAVFDVIEAIGGWGEQVKGGAADLFNFWDTWARFTKFVHEVENNGAAHGDAIIEANEWAPDYSLVPEWVRALRNTVVPFITFAYKLTPKFIDQTSKMLGHIKRGEVFKAGDIALRFAAPMMLWGGVSSYLMALALGMDDDEHRALRASMAEWFRRNPGVIPMPMRDSRGRITIVDMGILFPWTMQVRAVEALSRGDAFGAVQQMGVGFPPGDIWGAWTTGIDPYTGFPLWDEASTAGEQNIARFAYLINYLTPPPLRGLTDPMVGVMTGNQMQLGSGEIARIADITVGDGMTASGRPVEDPQYVAARMLLGFNFNAFHPNEQIRTNMARIENGFRVLDEREARIRSDYRRRTQNIRRDNGDPDRLRGAARERERRMRAVRRERQRLRERLNTYRRQVAPIRRFENENNN